MTGGYIIKKYHAENIESLMCEIKFNCYIKDIFFGEIECPPIDESLFENTQEKLKCVLAELITVPF